MNPGTPAAEAGLLLATLTTGIAGQSVSSGNEVQAAIGAKKPGDTVQLTYTRDGQPHTITVTLTNRPENFA